MAQHNIVFYPSEIAACIGQNYFKPRDVMLAQYLRRYSPCRAQLRELVEEHERVRSAVQNAMYSMPADQASQVANELLTVVQEEAPREDIHAPLPPTPAPALPHAQDREHRLQRIRHDPWPCN